ncbi:MAG: NADPH-dependent F420 reductase [Acidobacteriaceae bacterium]|nr:NADPH-dependent F420 reductase [Acidobacteriaceae bacterium]
MSLKIAILGAGNVGGALGRIWSGKGHQVVFGLPDPNSSKAKGIGKATTNAEAASTSDIIAVCVPWPAAQNAIQDCGSLQGKILIDCLNPLKKDLSGLEIGCDTSAAEKVAGWAPGAKVVKAFNTIGAVNFGNTQFGSVRADGFYCGDDADAKNTVKGLIEDAGFDPVDVGPLKSARLLEPLAMLWIDLAVNQKQGPSHAFKLLRR